MRNIRLSWHANEILTEIPPSLSSALLIFKVHLIVNYPDCLTTETLLMSFLSMEPKILRLDMDHVFPYT